jgi:ubiquinone/menaquinone biosynthesis C-methylase UbiE
MLRSISPTANIFGCDINPVISEATQRFARLEYTQLKHAWLLPYEDNKFDAIIAAGVIEHVPFPARSLEELYRVMEEGGTLVITFLPNAKSYTELAARTLVKAGYHHRIYNKKVIGDLLKTHGFEPLIVGHHQVLPSLAMGHYSLKNKFVASALRRLFKLDPFVEKVWPFKVFSANLYVIARKRAYM